MNDLRPGHFVVSRAEHMTLYGQVEEVRPDGLLVITRHWRTARDTSRPPKHISPNEGYQPFDRAADAPCWHRKPGDCELYDFRRGPLYSAAGRKHTLHRAISGE